MKVLQVIPYFRFKSGGDVNVCFNLSKELRALGHDVTVLTMEDGVEGDIIESCQNLGIETIILKGTFQPLSYLYDKQIIKWLRTNISTFNIVHLHTFRSSLNIHVINECIRFSVPYIIQAHGSLTTFYKRGLEKKIYDFIWGHQAIKNAAGLIALNEKESQEYTIELKAEVLPVIIPNGIDVGPYQTIKRGALRDELNIDQNEFIITYLGRIVEDKGIDIALKSFSLLNLNDIRFLIIGPDFGHWGHLEKTIRDLNIERKVIYLGFINDDVKKQALLDSDLFITPKYTGFPITFLESCASGTPILTTTKGDKLDWIDGKVGIVTNYEETEIANAILRFVKDDALRENMISECMSLASSFGWNKVAMAVISLYLSSIASFNTNKKQV